MTKLQEETFMGSIDREHIPHHCPATQESCSYYSCQVEENGDVSICFCDHENNKSPYEGNCTKVLCPLLASHEAEKGIMEKDTAKEASDWIKEHNY